MADTKVGDPTGRPCLTCGGILTYRATKRTKTGFTSECKACNLRRTQERYKTDPGYKARWRADNVDRDREIQRNSQVKRRSSVAANLCSSCKGEDYASIPVGRVCTICCSAPAAATDHVVPVSQGGAHCNDNFTPVCRACNSAKGNRLWPGEIGWEKFLRDRRSR